MNSKTAPFRVGRVRVFRRGRIWYLAYFEQGQRRQPRVGPDRSAAKQMAKSEIQQPARSPAAPSAGRSSRFQSLTCGIAGSITTSTFAARPSKRSDGTGRRPSICWTLSATCDPSAGHRTFAASTRKNSSAIRPTSTSRRFSKHTCSRPAPARLCATTNDRRTRPGRAAARSSRSAPSPGPVHRTMLLRQQNRH